MAEPSVLIVDDDRSIVRLCQRLLERASFKVFASTDPTEAIHIMEARKLDLLLSDIRMPVMDGFELIERAKQLQPDLAVLVMTGFGTVDTAVQALYKGVDGLILKPFENTTDLVNAAQRVLADSHQKQDAARVQVLRPLFELSETLLAETSLQPLEKLVIKSMLDMFQSGHAGVYTLANNEDFQLMMEYGLPDPSPSLPAWPYLTQYITHSDLPGLINAVGPGDVDLQTALHELGWAALMIVPVHRKETEYIFFTARDSGSSPFNESDLELFTILSRQSGVAVENARLYTDLRNSLQRVEESQRALVQAEKMAAVGRLMASLAHEINNPLQAVRNCLHLASRNDVSEDQRANYLAMTAGELDRLVNTVRHMLDFYRPGQIEKESVDILGAIERVKQLLKSQFDHQGIHCQIDIPQDYPSITGVRDQVQQVFFNLMLNSMDAMEKMEKGKNIWIDAENCGDCLCVYVEDSGPGIPEELREKLFEPFISTKTNGTGLGLAVSYGVVESHGGQLQLANPRHGNGACFEIKLPLRKVS